MVKIDNIQLASSMNDALSGMIITGVEPFNKGKYPRVIIHTKSESGESETDFSFVYEVKPE
jgi:hypothetical protein